MKKKRYFSRTVCFLLCAVFALLFLLPTVLTITNSFMTQSEITASYGQVFENANDGKSYISKTIELKFIPDKVSFTQYFTVLLKSPAAQMPNSSPRAVSMMTWSPTASVSPFGSKK